MATEPWIIVAATIGSLAAFILFFVIFEYIRRRRAYAAEIAAKEVAAKKIVEAAVKASKTSGAAGTSDETTVAPSAPMQQRGANGTVQQGTVLSHAAVPPARAPNGAATMAATISRIGSGVSSTGARSQMLSNTTDASSAVPMPTRVSLYPGGGGGHELVAEQSLAARAARQEDEDDEEALEFVEEQEDPMRNEPERTENSAWSASFRARETAAHRDIQAQTEQAAAAYEAAVAVAKSKKMKHASKTVVGARLLPMGSMRVNNTSEGVPITGDAMPTRIVKPRSLVASEVVASRGTSNTHQRPAAAGRGGTSTGVDDFSAITATPPPPRTTSSAMTSSSAQAAGASSFRLDRVHRANSLVTGTTAAASTPGTTSSSVAAPGNVRRLVYCGGSSSAPAELPSADVRPAAAFMDPTPAAEITLS